MYSLLVVVMIFMSLTSGSYAAEKTNADKAEKEIDSLVIKKNQDFREQFGLSTDESVIKEALKNNKSKYDMALTESETIEFDKRMKLQKDFPEKIKDIEKELSQTVESVYIDQLDGGRLVVGFKDENLVSKMNLKKEYSSNEVKFKHIKYSTSDLKNKKEEIVNARNDLESKGIRIVGVGLSIEEEKVVIEIENPTTEDIATLNSLFGEESIKIEKGEMKEPFDRASNKYRPVAAGAQFNPQGYFCTVGFSAKDSSNNNYLVTAGHCIDGSGLKVYQSYDPNATTRLIGTTANESYNWNTKADAGLVSVSSTHTTSYLLSNQTTADMIISARQLNDYEGLLVCLSLGETNSHFCTKITDTDWEGLYNDLVWLKNQRKTASGAKKGDSGSPVYASCGLNCGNYVAIYGLVSGGNSNTTIISYITNIEEALGVSVITDKTSPAVGITIIN